MTSVPVQICGQFKRRISNTKGHLYFRHDLDSRNPPSNAQRCDPGELYKVGDREGKIQSTNSRLGDCLGQSGRHIKVEWFGLLVALPYITVVLAVDNDGCWVGDGHSLVATRHFSPVLAPYPSASR